MATIAHVVIALAVGQPERLRTASGEVQVGASGSPSPARRSPPRSTAQRRDGHVQRARQCGQVAVVHQSAVDLIGELVQRRDPGGALRQDLDLHLTSDGDADLDLNEALNQFPRRQS